MTAAVSRSSWLGRFQGKHSYWVVLLVILSAFFVAALTPDTSWAVSLLVLIETGTLVLAVRTAGMRVLDARLLVGLVAGGVVVAVAALVWNGDAATATLDILTGLLTLAIVIVIALGAIRQGEVNSKSVAGALCVYVLIGMMFLFVYGVIAALGNGPLFAQGTDGTRAIRLYFSFITLTTVGFGDYTPLGKLSRALSALEAMTGGLYLVTVISIVVSRLSLSAARRTSTVE